MRRDLISKVMREMGRRAGRPPAARAEKRAWQRSRHRRGKELASKAAQARWAKAKKKRKPFGKT